MSNNLKVALLQKNIQKAKEKPNNEKKSSGSNRTSSKI